MAVSDEQLVRPVLDESPMDRALLGLLAEQVRTAGGGPVGDLGCGPGRIADQLDLLGVPAFGIDPSPGMVDVARRTHPRLRFDVGSLTALPLPDGGLAGALAWYSVIHTPPKDRPRVFAELARVLRPGGLLVLAFQAGADEPVHHRQGYGYEISLHAWRMDPQRVERELADSGLVIRTRVLREPEPSLRERSRQA